MGDILSRPENLIEDIIGHDAYLDLCAWCGGTNYYVPSDSEDHNGLKLERAIGRPGARRLVDWAGGSIIYVPSRYVVELYRRRDEINVLRRRGKTVQEIAREYRYEGRYTERQIWRLLSSANDTDLDLLA